MLPLPSASMGVWGPLLCSECEDSFNLASSAHSESWKCLGTTPLPQPPGRLLTLTDECSSIYNTLPPALWGVVALSLQRPLQDSAKSSFHLFHSPMPLLVVLNTVPDEPYYISTWCLLLRSWPKTAAPSHLKSRLFQDHCRVVSLFDFRGDSAVWKSYSVCGSTFTIKEDIPNIQTPFAHTFSWSTCLLLEHAGICPDPEEPRPRRQTLLSQPPSSSQALWWLLKLGFVWKPGRHFSPELGVIAGSVWELAQF